MGWNGWRREHKETKSGGQKEKMKTETEMGGMREERLGGRGMGVENESEGRGVETAVKQDQ